MKLDSKKARADLLTAGNLAEILGVSLQTVRRLQGRGLTPLREPNGDRLYLPGAIPKAKALLRRRLARRRKAKVDV